MPYISDNLLLDLPFYESNSNNKSEWLDESGRGYSAIANDNNLCKSSDIDRLGSCLKIKAGGELKFSKGHPPLDKLHQLTIEFWAEPDTVANGEGQKLILGGPIKVWMAGDSIYWTLVGDPTNKTYTVKGVSGLHHWAIVLDDTAQSPNAIFHIFRDAVEIKVTELQVSNDSGSSVPPANAPNLVIGAEQNGWTGKLAHLRIWNRAMQAEELQANQSRDITASAAFKDSTGMDWQLLNAYNEPSLYIFSSTQQKLRLEMTNTTKKTTLVVPKNDSDASIRNYHFQLVFRSGTIASPLLSGEKNNPFLVAIQEENPDWSISVDHLNDQDCISFLRKKEDISLAPKENLKLFLPKIAIEPSSGSRSTQVMLQYQNIKMQADELQANQSCDITASAVFKDSTGMDWQLLNAYNEPSLYIFSSTQQKLRLEMTNTTKKTTLVVPKNDSDASIHNYHFQLVFQSGTIASPLLTVEKTNPFLVAIQEENPDWSISVDHLNDQDCISFLRKKEDISLAPKENLKLFLPKIAIEPSSGSRSTQVMLQYQNITLPKEPSPPLENMTFSINLLPKREVLDGHREQVLNILYRDDSYRKPPLEVGVVGAPAILNNGTETCLTLYIKNLKQAAPLVLGSANVDPDKPPKFILEIDSQPNHENGLGDNDDLNAVMINNKAPENSSGVFRWQIEKDRFTENETFLLQLTSLKTTAPPGRSVLRLCYKDFDEYGEGGFEIPIDRVPAIPAKIANNGAGYGLAIGFDPRKSNDINLPVLNEVLSVKQQSGYGDTVHIENAGNGSGLSVVQSQSGEFLNLQPLFYLNPDTIKDNQLKDASGKEQGTVYGTPPTIINDQKLGKCLQFDGDSKNYVRLPDGVIPNGEAATFSFWAWGADSLPGIETSPMIADDSKKRHLVIELPNINSKIGFVYGNSETTDYIRKTATPKDFKGGWNHWAFTKDTVKGEMNIYLNGELWCSSQEVSPSKLTPDEKLGNDKKYSARLASQRGFLGYIYPGKIAHFRTYTQALSLEQIRWQMHKDCQKAAVRIESDGVNTGLTVNQQGNGLAAKFSGGSGVEIDGQLQVGQRVDANPSNVRAKLYVSAGKEDKATPSLENPIDTNQDLLLHLRLAELSLSDLSTFKRKGTVTGDLRVAIDPQLGNCFLFEGNQSIAYSDISLNNSSFTIQFWAKREEDQDGNYRFIIGQGGENAPNKALHIGFRTKSENKFTFAFYGNDLDVNMDFNDKKWHHWACVYDQSISTRTLYQDGKSLKSDTNVLVFSGEGDLLIGKAMVGQNFKGKLADIRIHKTALSAEEISLCMRSILQEIEQNQTKEASGGLFVDPHVNDLAAKFDGGSGVEITGNLQVGQRIRDKTGEIMPVGAVLPFAGNNAPDGWLLCNGQQVFGKKYKDLAKVLFNEERFFFSVPNYQEKFLVGASSKDDYKLWKTGGSEKVTLGVNQMPKHTHDHSKLTVKDGGEHSHGFYIFDGNQGQGNNVRLTKEWEAKTRQNFYTHLDGKHTHGLEGDIGQAGGDSSHENLPPFVALNYIIKY